MAFEQVQSLDCEITTALGGINRKTGKPNPTKAEGYLIGTKEVDSPKSKTGKACLHILQTDKGRLGVWGKTDLDRKLRGVAMGTMVRITQDRKVKTPNGEMYCFLVEQDKENCINVAALAQEETEEDDVPTSWSTEGEDGAVDSDEDPVDETAAERPKAPAVASKAPDAERQARVKGLLARKTVG
jgi:hypothetical protein